MTNLSANKRTAEEQPVAEIAAESAGMAGSLLSISKSTRAFLSLLLADIGLYPGQDHLLERLELDRPVSVSVLAEQLSVRPSTVSKMLDRLIEKNLVRRLNFEGDARRTMVHLTEAGEEMRGRIRTVWGRFESELSGNLSDEDRRRLATALTEVDAILSTRLRRLR